MKTFPSQGAVLTLLSLLFQCSSASGPLAPRTGPYAFRTSLSTVHSITTKASQTHRVSAQTLQSPALQRLRAGASRPQGWLRDELTLQAKGLSGDLPWFWSYINGSTWLGGPGEGGVNGVDQYLPYYLNGLVPLSYQVDDAALQAVRDRYVDHILTAAENITASGGWLGPPITANTSHAATSYWGTYPAVEALQSLAEADARRAPRVVAALVRHFAAFGRHLAGADPPLHDGRWAFSRYSDAVVGLQWMLDLPHPALPATVRKKLWQLMELIVAEASRTDSAPWEQWFRSGDPLAPWHDDVKGRGARHMLHHGVDIAQAVKTGALASRITAAERDRVNSWVAVEWVTRYAHMSTGMFFADELLQGNNTPSRGTETCSVVEMMFSLRTAWEITGNVTFMDRLEEVAFNALPAALYPDVTANVYFHASNQIGTGSGQYHYGLFFCCSANMHQGWPKFALSPVHTAHNRSAVVISTYAPSSSSLPGPTSDLPAVGNVTTVAVEGAYPFSDEAVVVINRNGSAQYTHALLRIPCWTHNATIVVDAAPPEVAPACVLHRVPIPPDPSKPTRIHVSFHNPIRLKFWSPNSTAPGAVEVHRGALTYALRPLQNVTTTPIRGARVCASRSISAASPWNYALLVDAEHPEATLRFEASRAVPSPVPFAVEEAPAVRILARGRRVHQWVAAAGSGVGDDGDDAAIHPLPPPRSPLASEAPLEELELVPFGATNIRISVFPTLRENVADAPLAPYAMSSYQSDK